MKCWICGNDEGSRKNMVLDHWALYEIQRCVCNECFQSVRNDEYESYSVD